MTAPYDAFNWLTDLVFVTLYRLFQEVGAPIVFVAALAEATVIVGVFFPGLVIMFLGGAAASQGATNLWVIFPLAVVGTVLGDLISYTLGRWGGERLSSTRLGPTLRMGSALMAGRARWLIPFYHLHNFTRAVGPFGAGALRMPFPIWAPLDALGAVIANTIWIGAGYVLGAVVLTEEGKLVEHPALRIGLAIFGVTWFVVFQRAYLRRMEEQRARDEAAAGDASATPGRDTETS